MVRVLIVLAGLVLSMAPAAQAETFEVGETVLAFWEKGNAWFVGTLAEKSGDDFLVVFEDGDTVIVAPDKIRPNNIRVGSEVIARFKDGKYYRGKVAKIVGRALYIHYADGDQGWAPWSWIAVQ